MTYVLVVEDSPTQAKAIQLLMEDAGYTATVARDGVEALAEIGRSVPNVVVTDLEMPHLNGLQLVEAVRRDYPTLPVILMTAHGSEDIAALALGKGAAGYVPKSYLEDLGPTVERILTLTQSTRSLAQVQDRLARAEFDFVLGNDPSGIGPILALQDDLLTQLDFCDATERIRVRVALQEALLNAIYHGNLELGSELRQEDEFLYHDLARTRRDEPPYQDRRVHLKVRIVPSETVYTIRDEGPGFDPAALPDPTDPANLGRVGGRGLLLIRAFMSEVSHNEAGNEIRLTKRRD